MTRYFSYYNMEIIFILSLFIAVTVGVLVYLLFMSKRNDGRFGGRFLNGLYDFLHFRSFILKNVLKVLYVITAVFLTVFGILSIFGRDGGLIFVSTAIVGNIAARLAYELIMMFVKLVENTTEIRKAIAGAEDSDDYGSFDPTDDIDDDDFE